MSYSQPGPSTPYSTQAPASARYNVLAIVGFVLAFFFSIGAVVCGHIALSQIKRTGEQGRGLAIAALVLGYIGIAFGVLMAIIWIGFIAAAASSGSVGS